MGEQLGIPALLYKHVERPRPMTALPYSTNAFYSQPLALLPSSHRHRGQHERSDALHTGQDGWIDSTWGRGVFPGAYWFWDPLAYFGDKRGLVLSKAEDFSSSYFLWEACLVIVCLPLSRKSCKLKWLLTINALAV